MHAISFLVAFIFFGVATAGVIPDSASLNNTVPNGMGGEGNHTGPMSSLPSNPSSFPTGAPSYPMPSNLQDHPHSPTSHILVGANVTSARPFNPVSSGPEPTSVLPNPSGESHSPPPAKTTLPHSFHPMSGGPEPTGTPGGTDLPTPGADSYPPPVPSSGSQPAGGHSFIPSSEMGNPSGAPPYNSTQPTGPPPCFPSGVSDYPLPSGARGHKSGLPSDMTMTMFPTPTPSDA